jgi:hypothetical protein
MASYLRAGLLERVRSAVNRAFVEMFCDQHHADWQTVTQAARQGHRRVMSDIERRRVYQEFKRTLQVKR